MAGRKYDNGEEYYDEYDEFQDEREDDYDLYDDEDDCEFNTTNEEFQEDLPVIQWRRIKLGQVVLDISDRGTIRPRGSLFEASKGFAYIGTPYKTYTVELEPGVRKEYFVHDLVWRAFNGDPPEGWEVRHTFNEANKCRKYYSNALKNLVLTPSTVEHSPKLFSNTI